MKEQNNDTELQQLLREKLEEHTVPAPDFVWPAIEKELFPASKKRRPFFWWFVFSGLLLGTLSLFFVHQSTTTELSAGKSATALHKTVQSTAHSITQPRQQTSSAIQPNLTENSPSDATTSKSNESVIQVSEKNEHSFKQSNQSGVRSKKDETNSHAIQQTTAQSTAQKTFSSGTGKPITAIPARSIAGLDLLATRTTTYLAGFKPIADKSLADSANSPSINPLTPKTIAFRTDSVKPIPPLLPPSKSFDGYSFMTFYIGAGRNHRTYSGIVESNSNAFIIDRTLLLKNTNFGMDYNYQFLPFASARIGLNTGSNRYITRLFPIRIANTDLNNELEISSPSGDLKSAPLELDDQASSISDTTTFLMRIVHRSRYFSVPLSIRFNTTNEKGPQLYGYAGFDFVFRGNDKNTLIVRKSQFERSYSTSNPRGARGFYSGWHLGVGLASNNSRRFQFFSEFNYSQVIGNYYSGKIISIRSSNVQLNVGLRINLKP